MAIKRLLSLFQLAGLALIISLGVAVPRDSAALDASVIDQIESDVLDQICLDNGDWLRCYNKPPAQCRQIAKEIVRACLDERLKYAPMGLDLQTALRYAVDSKSCFNRKVPSVLGEPQPSEACKTPPGHLQ